MRISTKLLAVTGLVSVFVIAVTAANFRELMRLRHNLNQIQDSLLVQGAAATEIQAALDEVEAVSGRIGGTVQSLAAWPALRQEGAGAIARAQAARETLARAVARAQSLGTAVDAEIERVWLDESVRDVASLARLTDDLESAWRRFDTLGSGLSAEAAEYRDKQILPLIHHEIAPLLRAFDGRIQQAIQHEIVETADSSAGMLRLQVAVGAGFLFVIFGVALGIHQIVIRPLREIETAARRVGKGERGFRVKYDRHDELGSVAHALNDMLDSLHASSMKRADLEVRVQQRTEQLDDLFNNVTDLIQSVSTDGRMLFVNRAWEETLGYSSEEVGRLNLLDVIAEESRTHCLDLLRRLVAGEDVGSIEVVFQSKDGRRIDLEGRVSVRCEDGVAVATRGIFRDVTAQRAAARRLRESEARLQRALAGGHQGHWEWAPAGRGGSLTGNWAEILEYPAGAVAADFASFEKLIHPDDRATALAALTAHVAEESEYYDHELRMRNASGRWRWVLVRGRLVERGPDKRAVRVAGTVTDIDARKRAEEALHDRDRRLQLISDNLTECALYQFTLGADGRELFSYFGAGIDRIFGEAPRPLPVGADWLTERLLPEDRPPMDAANRKSRDELSPFGQEARIRAADGRIKWISFRSNPRRLDDGGIVWDGIMIDITARRQAETELLAYRQRLDLALEASRTCTWDNDLVANRLNLDTRWSIMLGNEPVEVSTTARSLFSVVHSEDRGQALEAARQAYEGPSDTYRVEYRVQTRRGDWIWILSNGRVVDRDANGRATRIIGTNTDITERRRTEIAIQQHARFVSTLNTTALDLLEHSDREQLIQSLAVRAAQLFDASLAEISLVEHDELVVVAANRPHGRLIGSRAGRAQATVSWKAVDTCQPAILDDYSALPSRRRVYDPLQLRAIADFPIIRAGRGIGVISLARTQLGHTFTSDDVQKGVLFAQMTSLALHKADIYADALRVAEERTNDLRESEERFRGVFDKSPMIIGLLTMPEGRVMEFNAAAIEAFGYPREEAVGRTSLELGIWADNADRERYLQLLGERGNLTGFRTRMRRKDGTIFPALHSGSLVTIRGRALTLSSILDISAQVHAEEAQRAVEARLREAQKLESLGTLAGGIAHDFNNILSGMLGFVELARMDLPDDHAAREWVEGIGTSCLRAKEIVRQILTFSRRGDTARKPLRLEPVVRETLSLLRSTIPPIVELEQRIVANCPPVFADTSQIHQVIMNLCTNAWHALPERGGRIRLALEPRTVTPELAAEQPGLKPGPHVLLTVNDNGSGMDDATLGRIFEPFFTTKEAGRGTGLGLAVVLGIVQSHEGAIVVRSAKGQGTTIEVYLPVLASADHAAGPTRPAAEAALPHGRGQHVLVVDDEPVVAKVASRIVGNLDYQVRTFHQPLESLAYLRTRDNPVDILITDLAMPTMSGEELARHARALRPDLPVIVITGFIDPEQVAKLQNAGIREVLRKPLSARDLADALARHLPGRPDRSG